MALALARIPQAFQTSPPDRVARSQLLRSLGADIAEGLRFVRRHALIGPVTAMGIGQGFTGGAVLGLLVIYGVRQLGLGDDDPGRTGGCSRPPATATLALYEQCGWRHVPGRIPSSRPDLTLALRVRGPETAVWPATTASVRAVPVGRTSGTAVTAAGTLATASRSRFARRDSGAGRDGNRCGRVAATRSRATGSPRPNAPAWRAWTSKACGCSTWPAARGPWPSRPPAGAHSSTAST